MGSGSAATSYAEAASLRLPTLACTSDWGMQQRLTRWKCIGQADWWRRSSCLVSMLSSWLPKAAGQVRPSPIILPRVKRSMRNQNEGLETETSRVLQQAILGE